MTRPDFEIEHIRETVDCASFLERLPRPWHLDRRESTKNCLKYRRGKGEILIVVHDGRGWWDPNSDAKGDIFSLVQRLQPGLNFGDVRKVLRRFTGCPDPEPAPRRKVQETRSQPAVPISRRWAERPRLTKTFPTWTYLARERALPDRVLELAGREDVVREGPHASAWFAHKDAGGVVTHIEIRGPDFKGSLRGGTKTLFRFPGGRPPHARLLIAEAPIDVLSRAALEGIRADTLYAATGGGMGPGTIAAIEAILETLAEAHEKLGVEVLCTSATDANSAGDRYAARHETLAIRAGVPFERSRPPIEGGDWNDVLKTTTTTPSGEENGASRHDQVR